mmetsp:Transcript_21406/g.47448  ORF Transcript_21406/g.47448 Transcript_21406/m.47448 type:complete len:230 (+) Transcript_21406:1009-1698(+)
MLGISASRRLITSVAWACLPASTGFSKAWRLDSIRLLAASALEMPLLHKRIRTASRTFSMLICRFLTVSTCLEPRVSSNGNASCNKDTGSRLTRSPLDIVPAHTGCGPNRVWAKSVGTPLMRTRAQQRAVTPASAARHGSKADAAASGNADSSKVSGATALKPESSCLDAVERSARCLAVRSEETPSTKAADSRSAPSAVGHQAKAANAASERRATTDTEAACERPRRG